MEKCEREAAEKSLIKAKTTTQQQHDSSSILFCFHRRVVSLFARVKLRAWQKRGKTLLKNYYFRVRRRTCARCEKVCVKCAKKIHQK